ncbi:MAG: PRC-barrel domain-containing protein [Pseudomonadota bacterium]
MLKSTKGLLGFTVRARNSDVGRVKDALIDDDFRLRYFVVTTGWIGGRNVLLAAEWISRLDIQTKVAYADICPEKFDTAPEYREQVPVDEHYEKTLYEHFHKARGQGHPSFH